jgi:hypothetical protein
MNLLQMSFSGAAFITAVVIIRTVAINKLPKKTFAGRAGFLSGCVHCPDVYAATNPV